MSYPTDFTALRGVSVSMATRGAASLRHNPPMQDDRESDHPEPAPPVTVPYRELSAVALRGLVEAFVLREGTDYGTHEFSLEEKVAHVMRQLERGDAEVMFDPDTESASIVVAARPRARR